MAEQIDLNRLAIILKSLHISGRPLLLANVHDGSTASLVASLPQTKAVATASWGIAEVQGFKDEDLNLEANLAGISYIARGMREAGVSETIPLSADLQDGYENPADTIRRAIHLSIVGCNIEDLDNSQKPPTLRSIEDATARIRTVVQAAHECGVPDFVVNARCDVLGYNDGSLADVIERGRAYLAAGATTVFVWGVYKVKLTEAHIRELVKAFDGKLAVQPGIHSIATLQQLGVSRISVGPTLWRTSLAVMKKQAAEIVEGTYVPA